MVNNQPINHMTPAPAPPPCIIRLSMFRWNEITVGHSEIRNFIGALDFKHAERGIFITTSTFTKDIIEKVDRSSERIILIDGNELAR